MHAGEEKVDLDSPLFLYFKNNGSDGKVFELIRPYFFLRFSDVYGSVFMVGFSGEELRISWQCTIVVR